MRQTVNLSQTSDLSNVPETKQKSFYEYLNLPEPTALFDYPETASLSQVAVVVPKPEEEEEEETKNEYAELLASVKEQVVLFK